MNDNIDAGWFASIAATDDPFADKPFEVPQEVPAQTPAELVPIPDIQTLAPPPAVQQPKPAPILPDKADTAAEETEDEAKKRAAHEAAEAQRKAEFDARQAAKKQAIESQLAAITAMSADQLIDAAIRRATEDTEKLTRRNMKEMVTEHIQIQCAGDVDFARLTMHPRKSMVRCFQYICRKAQEYVQDEMKASGFQQRGQGIQVFASDIPDDLCYQWAEDYFRDPTVKEDQEEEETFVAKPYQGKPAKKTTKKTSPSKPKVKPPAAQKPETKPAAPAKPADDGQISFLGTV